MPEYLAPGVFVEETSFRAKSIEGVSTSTCGFVGPTNRGPIGETPELLTSFGDFERIYGGLTDLDFGTNYLAHGVRAFYNEGGSRLYVSRVFAAQDGVESNASVDVIQNADAAKQVRFKARTPGKAGAGSIALREARTPATRKTLEDAPNGTFVRVLTDVPPGVSTTDETEAIALPAQVRGGPPPYAVLNASLLRLSIGAANVDVTFHGTRVEVTAPNALDDPVPLDATNSMLTLTIDGRRQTVAVPFDTPPTPAQLVDLLNPRIVGGFARLEGGKLVIGSDRSGRSAMVSVQPNATFGFPGPAPLTVQGDSNPAVNNVADLDFVSVDEINQLISAATAAQPPAGQARAALSPDNRLVVSTVATGVGAALSLPDPGASSALARLGLAPVPAPIKGSDGATVTYYVKHNNVYVDGATPPNQLNLATLPATGVSIVTLAAVAQDRDGYAVNYENMAFDSAHPQYIGTVLAEKPVNRADALQNPLAIIIGQDVTAHALHQGLFPMTGHPESVFALTGGGDGTAPTPSDYADALRQLEKLDDISIVAAPGYSSYGDSYQGIQNELLIHVDNPKRTKYRVAVLDTPDKQTVGQVREIRGKIDSTRAALYYPWVKVPNPLWRPGRDTLPRELSLPPSAFLCGIYARNDVQRGVYKAPANEVVMSALRFETEINTAQQEVLNPLGVNCLRAMPGRGYRVWGARTVSSDPEWKYINVRRYFHYLESSIDRGTQWAVFEPNGERLWANIVETIDSFLYNEWVSGALLGGSPKEAYFVRCDRSTMTQGDLDNGRLICLIGVAPLKPAEFVIFRIGQKTADARS